MTWRSKRCSLKNGMLLLLAASVAFPEVGRAAPAKLTVSELRAAEAVAAFNEGARLESAGEVRAAAGRYRAAADANRAALEALDKSSPSYLARARTLATRIVTAYEAALHVTEDPALRLDAGGWCIGLFLRPDVNGNPTFATIQKKCTQWPVPATAPAPAPPEQTRGEPPTREASPLPPVDPQKKTVIAGVDIQQPEGPTTPRTDLPPTQEKPWRELAIGGGVALGIGTVSLIVTLVGTARQLSLQKQFDELGCMVREGECREVSDRGVMFERLTVSTLVTGGVLAGIGTALLTVAMRRRSAAVRRARARLSFTPVSQPQFLGLSLRGRF